VGAVATADLVKKMTKGLKTVIASKGEEAAQSVSGLNSKV
jgi:hypothetical protein